MGGDDGSRQRRWREFLMRIISRRAHPGGWVAGDETFPKRVQGYQGRAVQRRRGRLPKPGGQAAGISS